MSNRTTGGKNHSGASTFALSMDKQSMYPESESADAFPGKQRQTGRPNSSARFHRGTASREHFERSRLKDEMSKIICEILLQPFFAMPSSADKKRYHRSIFTEHFGIGSGRPRLGSPGWEEARTSEFKLWVPGIPGAKSCCRRNFKRSARARKYLFVLGTHGRHFKELVVNRVKKTTSIKSNSGNNKTQHSIEKTVVVGLGFVSFGIRLFSLEQGPPVNIGGQSPQSFNRPHWKNKAAPSEEKCACIPILKQE